MALIVKEVINKTDSELTVIDSSSKSVERIAPDSSKDLPNDNLLDLTFVSKTARPIYIRIRSVPGDVGNGDDPVTVEAGDPDQEEDT